MTLRNPQIAGQVDGIVEAVNGAALLGCIVVHLRASGAPLERTTPP
ncbi:MAG: hypothetical protein R2911_37470 [Caldilineaceae bacterium]